MNTASWKARRATRATVGRMKKQDAGFTLVELMIGMAIIVVLAMGSAIDSYTMDKQKAARSLDDLIQDGYLKTIPKDPMTNSNTTWQTDTSDSIGGLDQTCAGVDDVHLDSDETGT